jgi:hypothetical protein
MKAFLKKSGSGSFTSCAVRSKKGCKFGLMRSVLKFLAVYHGCFFGISILSAWIIEGYGSEIFAFTWWFNISYLVMALPIHLVVFYIGSVFSWTRSSEIELRILTVLVVINFVSYYTNGALLTLELFRILQDGSYESLWFHGLILLSFVMATWAGSSKETSEESS